MNYITLFVISMITLVTAIGPSYTLGTETGIRTTECNTHTGNQYNYDNRSPEMIGQQFFKNGTGIATLMTIQQGPLPMP